MVKPFSIRVGRKTLKFNINKVERKWIIKEIFYSQNYFPRISAELDYKIRPKDTVMDIGAMEYHRPAVNELALAKFLGQRGFVVTITYYGRWMGGMMFAKKKFQASQ